MSFWDKFSDKVSDFSSNFSDRVNQQLATLKEQSIKLPAFKDFFGNSDASPNVNKQNNLALHRVALNVAVIRVPGMTLEPLPRADEGERVFKTIGGEWRKTETGSPHFYHPGEDTAGTKLFDQEYYQPPADQYEMAREGYWIKLAPNGGLRDLPENKDKAKPENVSDFEWKGFAWCHPDNVPADYKTEGKTVTFANEQAAQNPVNVLKRYVAENGLTDGLQWDEAKATKAFENVIAGGGRIELEKIGEAGKSIYNVKMDDESLSKLRTELAKYKQAVGSDDAGGVKGQQQGTFMAGDTFKVYGRAIENTIENVPNTMLEVIDPSIKIDPHNLTRARIGDIMDSQLPPPNNGAREHVLPRVDLSPIKPDYNSDLFNRDIFTGKVDKDGITVGKVSETAVELSAPIVAGKVFASAELPQGLHIENATTETLVYEADAMAAKSGNGGRTIIGRRAKAEEISVVEKELEKGGVKIVKNADARIDKLNARAAAAFDFEKGELLLRKDATFLEMYHEKTHAAQWSQLGKENYLKLGRLAREEHVYKTIMENKKLFSQRELDEASAVIQKYRIQKSQGIID